MARRPGSRGPELNVRAIREQFAITRRRFRLAGIGSAFLYAPRSVCDAAPPYVPAGGTVAWVTENDASYKGSPERHEGGTPNIAEAIAFGASLRFLERAGMEAVQRHERALTELVLEGLRRIEGVTVLGHPDPAGRLGILSFTLADVPHEQVANLLNLRLPSRSATAASAHTPTSIACSASQTAQTSGGGSKRERKRTSRARCGPASGSITPGRRWKCRWRRSSVLPTTGSAKGPLRRCASSKDKHADRGPEHEKCRDAHRGATENRARLPLHQLATRSDEENSDEEKRGQQPIYDRGPVESL